MDELLYQMIYKRKSFHLFRSTGNEKITEEELEDIKQKYKDFIPLVDNIKTDIQIIPANLANCNRGEEYCIYLYSEVKENYLQNIGYIGEQLDLYLASRNIGALWFGIGKAQETYYNNLQFVIMIAIRKVPKDKFRQDMFKSKRKAIEEIWKSTNYQEIAEIVRFAPSSCNTQPWIVKENGKQLEVYRYKKPGKRGIMPVNKVIYYNRIDIGIFMLFLDITLKHNNISYKKEILNDCQENSDAEETLVAVYKL